MARYGNCRNLPLGSINHINFSLKKNEPFLFEPGNKNILKIDAVEPLQLQNWGGCSRKNVITQSWWTNTVKMDLAGNIDSELSFLRNTDGCLYVRKIFVKSFHSLNASQTMSKNFHSAATSVRIANNVQFIT